MAENLIRAHCPHCRRRLRLMNVPAYKVSVKCPDCGSPVPLREDNQPRPRKPKSTVAVLVEETAEQPLPALGRSSVPVDSFSISDFLHHPLFHVLLFIGLLLVGYLVLGELNPRQLAQNAQEHLRDTIAHLAVPEPSDLVPADWEGACRYLHLRKSEPIPREIAELAQGPFAAQMSKVDEVYVVTCPSAARFVITIFREALEGDEAFQDYQEGEPYRSQPIYLQEASAGALFSGRVAVTAETLSVVHAAIDRYLDAGGARIDFGKRADVTSMFQSPFRDSSKVATAARLSGMIPIEFTDPKSIERIRSAILKEGSTGEWTVQVRLADVASAQRLAEAYLEQNKRFRHLLDRAVAESEIAQSSDAYRIGVDNLNTVPTFSGNSLELKWRYSEKIQRLIEREIASHVETSSPPSAAESDPYARHPQLLSLRERHGSDKTLLVRLKNVPTHVDRDTLRRWLASFDGVPDRESILMVEDSEVLIALAPIHGTEALLAQLTFGQAEFDPETRQIEVTVTEPSALPRPSRPAPPAKRNLRLAPTDSRTLTQVITALAYGDTRSRSDAIDYLRKHEPVAEQQGRVSRLLEKALEDPKMWGWEPAPRAFVLWMTKDHVPTLIRLAKHPSTWVRTDALERLSDFPDPRVVEVLVEALANDRGAAEDSLMRIGPVAEPAMCALLRSTDRADQLTGCKVLAMVGSKSSVTELERLASGSDESLAAEAKRALEYIAY